MQHDTVKPRILLTGFGPFANVAVNPSGRLMEHIAALTEPFPGIEAHTTVLDVDYSRCEEQFRQAIAAARPAAILAFGVHLSADDIRLERIAVNLDDATVPDNGGLRRKGARIAEEGPVGYWSTLPVEAMQQTLEAAGIPAFLSSHAGTYLCNHIFYYGQHWLGTQGLGIPMGFVHVPVFPEQVPEGAKQKGMALEALFRAAQVCVEVAVTSIK
jgi:pyroglutamyl-peptidase